MLKKALLGISLIAFLIAGIMYALNQAPEKKEQILVQKMLERFFLSSASWETEYQKKAKLSSIDLQFFLESDPKPQSVKMNNSSTSIVVRFGRADNQLSEQTIIMEPVIENQEVRWKCIRGSVLLRFRPRPCQLGKAITNASLNTLFQF